MKSEMYSDSYQNCIKRLVKAWNDDYNSLASGKTTVYQHSFTLEKTNNSLISSSYISRKGIDSEKNTINVEIYIPEKEKDFNILPVLHEVGHYIGCRNRTVRKKYLYELVKNAFLKEIFFLCYRRYYGYDNDMQISFYPKYKSDNDYFDGLLDALASMKKVFPKSSDISSQITGEYTDEVIDFSLQNISETFNSEEFSQKIKSYNEEVFYSDLEHAINTINAQLALHREQKSFPAWIEEMKIAVAEPTADCFMIWMSGIDYNQYINLVFNLLLKRWFETAVDEEIYDIDRFFDFAATPVMINRLLAIRSAMDAPDGNNGFKVTGEVSFRRISLREDKFKRKVSERFERMLSEIYAYFNSKTESTEDKNIKQDILNPQRLICEYIREYVYKDGKGDGQKDNRYNIFVNSHSDLIKEIRKYSENTKSHY